MANSYNIPGRYNICEPQYIEQQNIEIHKNYLKYKKNWTKPTIIVKIFLKI